MLFNSSGLVRSTPGQGRNFFRFFFNRLIAPCKRIQDSLGFWIPRCVFRIPGTGFQSLDSRFQQLVGFRIAKALFRIPKPRIPDSTSKISRVPDSTSKNFPDSGFHKQNFSDSGFHKQTFPGFRNPLHGANLKLFIQLRGSFPLSYLYAPCSFRQYY